VKRQETGNREQGTGNREQGTELFAEPRASYSKEAAIWGFEIPAKEPEHAN